MKSQRYYERLKKKLEELYTPAFFYALRKQKKPILDAFRSADSILVGKLRAEAVGYTISSEPLMKVYRRMYRKVSLNEARDLYRSMIGEKRLGALDIDWLADITDFLDNYLLNEVVVPMTARTMFRIQDVLTQGVALGWSYDQMLRELTDTKLDKVRARLIARTEVNRAVNYGHKIGAADLPFATAKKWSSARDNRTRGTQPDDKTDHYHMNDQSPDADGLFTDPKSGARMEYPGDSRHGAGAGDVCNCRCTVIYEPQRDKRGNLIMKQ